LQLRSNAERLEMQVTGEVRSERGTYRAYGQNLLIDRGVLRFSGPYANPTLDIAAVRPNTTIKVGVQISGTANSPRVRLFSEPELPESEKLSWLVLGRAAGGGGAEAAVLQQAALALLANGRSQFDGGIAQAFGLDELSVSGGSGSAADTGAGGLVTLGKRFSEKLYVTYERSLSTAVNTVSIFYDVSKRLTLRAQTGQSNAVDLIFTHAYD
jgi:translocation and assembly module TamB